jgi:hypothetical protein
VSPPTCTRAAVAAAPDPPKGSPALLTGPDAGGLLGTALAAVGGEVCAWRIRQVSLTGSGATATFLADVRWTDGSTTTELLAACTGDLPARAALLHRGDGDGERVAVWRVPHDPDLPGLAAAFDPPAVTRLLAELGLGGGPLRLALRAYRPRRRAVVEAAGPQGRVFLKGPRSSPRSTTGTGR